MERLFFHGERHVVVATGDVVDGRVPVRWVGLNPSVSGTSKRGRRPRYADPVSTDELTEITDADVIAQFAAPAGDASAS